MVTYCNQKVWKRWEQSALSRVQIAHGGLWGYVVGEQGVPGRLCVQHICMQVEEWRVT